MDYLDIIKKLPYSDPFLFVDRLIEVNESGVRGSFTFNTDLDFYRGHFKEQAVTPGVILTECCAQIGLVPLGILLRKQYNTKGLMALSSTEMEFYQAVYPGETVEVISEKIFFRFGKLKCRVKMYNSKSKLVCKGVIAGMLKLETDEN